MRRLEAGLREAGLREAGRERMRTERGAVWPSPPPQQCRQCALPYNHHALKQRTSCPRSTACQSLWQKISRLLSFIRKRFLQSFCWCGLGYISQFASFSSRNSHTLTAAFVNGSLCHLQKNCLNYDAIFLWSVCIKVLTNGFRLFHSVAS